MEFHNLLMVCFWLKTVLHRRQLAGSMLIHTELDTVTDLSKEYNNI